MPKRKVRRVISAHPPEADGIADAFGQARRTAEDILAQLKTAYAAFNSEWEGRQQVKFQERLDASIRQFQNALIPHLDTRERKYRNFKAEKIIEVEENY
jgi:uncharacterized protein YukE